jgi:hypothetical protein
MLIVRCIATISDRKGKRKRVRLYEASKHFEDLLAVERQRQ